MSKIKATTRSFRVQHPAFPRFALALLWLALLMALLAPQVLSAQSGDAVYGKEMLEVRHCTACHPVEGVGNGRAPDLGRPSPKDASPAGVAASMWNHAPQMWQQMEQQNIPVPTLTWLDSANLYAYLYSVRYFDPPGDAKRGEAGIFVQELRELPRAEAQWGYRSPRTDGAACLDMALDR